MKFAALMLGGLFGCLFLECPKVIYKIRARILPQNGQNYTLKESFSDVATRISFVLVAACFFIIPALLFPSSTVNGFNIIDYYLITFFGVVAIRFKSFSSWMRNNQQFWKEMRRE